LRDSIAGPERKAKIEQLSNMNLIPPQMKRLMKPEPNTIKKENIKKAIAKN
jgi:hypothetical protein